MSKTRSQVVKDSTRKGVAAGVAAAATVAVGVTIGGERRVRALMSLAGSKNAIPAYLPEAVEPRLPLFRRFRAVAIAEIRPREDQFETHGDALLVLALGRLIPARR